MPYIDKVAQQRLSNADQPPTTAGELNFLLTVEIINYVRQHPDGLRYAQINTVVSVLEATKLITWTLPWESMQFSPEQVKFLQAVQGHTTKAMAAGMHRLEVLGALECAKMEFYRRVAAPYEREAMAKNGDVYPPELVPTYDLVTVQDRQ